MGAGSWLARLRRDPRLSLWCCGAPSSPLQGTASMPHATAARLWASSLPMRASIRLWPRRSCLAVAHGNVGLQCIVVILAAPPSTFPVDDGEYSICAPTLAFERERGVREAMDRFHRNFRDNLRTTPGGLVIAAAIVAALVLLLVLAYSFFHLGEPPPAPR